MIMVSWYFRYGLIMVMTKSRSISTVEGSGATCTRNFFELFFQNRWSFYGPVDPKNAKEEEFSRTQKTLRLSTLLSSWQMAGFKVKSVFEFASELWLCCYFDFYSHLYFKNYICGKSAFNLQSFFLMGGLNILNMYWLWTLHSSPRVGFPKQHL